MHSMPTYSVTEVPQNITDLIVTQFRVVAHAYPVPLPDLKPNHWSIDLVHTHGSVRLNVEPDAPSTIVEVTVADLGIDVAIEYLWCWDFPAIDNVAVWHIIELILRNRRWKYDMTAERVGSRHWV